MATINRENIQYYVDKGLIDPSKVKIDLNKTKTAGDNIHRWVTLQSAIDSGYDFNFDYNVPEIKTPKTTELPELEVTAQTKPKLKPKTNTFNQGLKNFEDTFGFSVKEGASWLPFIGDVIDLYDIGSDLYNKNYTSAAIGAAAFALPNIIEKPVKYVYKHIPYKFIDKLNNIPNYVENIKEFFQTPINENPIKKLRKRKLQYSGKDVKLPEQEWNSDIGIISDLSNSEQLQRNRYNQGNNLYDRSKRGYFILTGDNGKINYDEIPIKEDYLSFKEVYDLLKKQQRKKLPHFKECYIVTIYTF